MQSGQIGPGFGKNLLLLKNAADKLRAPAAVPWRLEQAA
jgi:hypothetical protein